MAEFDVWSEGYAYKHAQKKIFVYPGERIKEG